MVWLLGDTQAKVALPVVLVWTSLRSGAPLEADAYHERILALAERHGVAAPVNRRVLECLREAAEKQLGPESFPASALLPR